MIAKLKKKEDVKNVTRLKELAYDFFNKHRIEVVELNKGEFDFIIKSGNTSIGVLMKDWNRAVGIDVVISAERIAKYSRIIKRIIIFSNKYSDPAKSLADRISVGLYDHTDIQEGKPIELINGVETDE